MKKVLNYFRLIKMLNKANIHYAWYKILENIMNFAVDVQQHGKPMLTKIAAVDMTDENPKLNIDIVSIWAGVGDANPIERISHLKAQNNELKRLLEICRDKIEGTGNEDLLLNLKLALDTFE